MTQSLAQWLSNLWVYADADTCCEICGEDIECGEKVRATGSGGVQGKSCCGSEEETK